MRDGNLRQIFRKQLPEVFWTSVETGATGRGVPDSFAIWKGCAVWIEFKSSAHWKTSLSPEQIAWHLRYARNGGRSFIAVRRQNSLMGIDELWIVRGELAELCVSLRELNALQASIYVGAPSRWDWASIRATLFVANNKPVDTGF